MPVPKATVRACFSTPNIEALSGIRPRNSLDRQLEETMLLLDNTKRDQARACKRKNYWISERDLKPAQGSTSLRYGSIWHAGQEGFYKHIMEHGWTRDGGALTQAVTFAKKEWEVQNEKQTFYDDYRTLENCLRALILYIAHFNHDEGMLQVTSVERVFKINMGCETEKESKAFPRIHEAGGFWFTGRLDAGIELDSRPWDLEHKTTGEALSKQKLRLHRSPQNIGYFYAARRLSKEPPEGCLISLHHLSAYKSKVTGLYGDAKVDFDRVPEIYTDGDIEEWRLSLMSTAEEILFEQERQIWPKDGDCYRYGQCPYTPLCQQNTPLGEEILEGYIIDPWDVTTTVPEEEVIVA
jgi:hypothetical protein